MARRCGDSAAPAGAGSGTAPGEGSDGGSSESLAFGGGSPTGARREGATAATGGVIVRRTAREVRVRAPMKSSARDGSGRGCVLDRVSGGPGFAGQQRTACRGAAYKVARVAGVGVGRAGARWTARRDPGRSGEVPDRRATHRPGALRQRTPAACEACGAGGVSASAGSNGSGSGVRPWRRQRKSKLGLTPGRWSDRGGSRRRGVVRARVGSRGHQRGVPVAAPVAARERRRWTADRASGTDRRGRACGRGTAGRPAFRDR